MSTTTTLQERPIELSVVSSRIDKAQVSVGQLSAASLPETSAPVTDEVPDGGYGWVIVMACSTIRCVPPQVFYDEIFSEFNARSFFYIGLTYSWGILQAKLAADHLAADSTLAFIG